jgi:hypothetical protein
MIDGWASAAAPKQRSRLPKVAPGCKVSGYHDFWGLHQADLRLDNSENAPLATTRSPSSVTFPFFALCMSF